MSFQSPWTSGVPPGLQQGGQQQVQPMFQQPMGAFDISAAWQNQQQVGQQQWMQAAPMHQVQYVPNPAYVRQQQQQHQPHHMHQRSLSAPRVGVNGPKRPVNQYQNNNSGPGGGGQQQQQHHWQNRGQNRDNQQRVPRQHSRMNNNQNQNRFNNNNGNHVSNNNNNNNNNVGRQNQNQQQQKQQQQQQQPQVTRKVKVTKVKKQQNIAAKLKPQANKANSVDDKKVSDNDNSSKSNAGEAQADSSANNNQSATKVQSKTAERKQLKLQARKNAEALKQSKLPILRASGKVVGNSNNISGSSDQKANDDQPIDQAQLKCVPAVFGFVCKLCDVFLRDKVARREHIDSDEHMEKFKAFEEEENAKKQEQQQQEQQQLPPSSSPAMVKSEEQQPECSPQQEQPETEVKTETDADIKAESQVDSLPEVKSENKTDE